MCARVRCVLSRPSVGTPLADSALIMKDARLMLSNGGCVAVGAAGGALLRYGIGEYGKRRGASATYIMMVNVLGSFLLGSVTGALPGTQAALLVGTGFCGAFTTFSTYSVDVVKLASAGHYIPAAGLAISTNVLSIGAAAAGLSLGASPAAARLVANARRATGTLPRLERPPPSSKPPPGTGPQQG